MNENSISVSQIDWSSLTWVLNSHDAPIKTVEKDNKKILTYDVTGIPHEMIAVKEEFVNKTKKMYLVCNVDHTDKYTASQKKIDIRLAVDTNIYDGWNYSVQDGILVITLFEKLNDYPAFCKVDKT